jgi:hypothetical protein
MNSLLTLCQGVCRVVGVPVSHVGCGRDIKVGYGSVLGSDAKPVLTGTLGEVPGRN